MKLDIFGKKKKKIWKIDNFPFVFQWDFSEA